jgi:hypothetical protein
VIEDQFADTGAFGHRTDLVDIRMEGSHPVERGAGEPVPLEVREVGYTVNEDVGTFLAKLIRSSFTVVSPENTTEPSAVSKR